MSQLALGRVSLLVAASMAVAVCSALHLWRRQRLFVTVLRAYMLVHLLHVLA